MHIGVVCCELVPREELAGHVFWLQPRGTYSGEGLRGYLGRHGKGAGLGIEG